jgi:hypothetical protein
MSRYHYEVGAVRWFRWDRTGDVRRHRPNKGWEARAEILDYHPITDRKLPEAQWWIRETYTGE